MFQILFLKLRFLNKLLRDGSEVCCKGSGQVAGRLGAELFGDHSPLWGPINGFSTGSRGMLR